MAAIAKSVTVQGLTPLRAPRKTLTVVASGGKIDIKKQGLNSIEDPIIQQNLMGRSRYMADKNWKDAQGRKGKGYGVYRFESKYGANVDGYSPIYTPDQWSEGGAAYKLGTKGLIAWAGLVLVLLAVGVNLIVGVNKRFVILDRLA